MPTYWNNSFSKICLGMKIHEQNEKHFILINRTADSLFSLIADGRYRATSLGRGTWKSFIDSEASLQPNCNMEGFNVISPDPQSTHCSKARIGIIANNEVGCDVCPDSRIGFGTGGYPTYSSTCGNFALDGLQADNGGKDLKAMGYILVQ